ncbi:hypothetical protein [Roseateles sp. P5_E11]
MRPIPLSHDLSVAMLRDLEFLVTSLDRIGSSAVSGAELNELLGRFIVEADVYRRLAAIRKSLWETVDCELTPAEVCELQASVEIDPWRG